MDIQVAVQACNTAIEFQEPQVALEFLKMVMGLIAPGQFVSFVKAIATNADAVDMAKEMVTKCLGVPS